MFSTFMVYDDEGYVLLSLKNFSEHGALYDKVYLERSRILALFTLCTTCIYLWQLINEPIHPGGNIVFVISLTLFLVSRYFSADRFAATMTILGCGTAVLFLTKINVGIFYLIGAGCWIVLEIKEERLRRLLFPILFIGLVLFPLVLMHTLLSESWVKIYASIFIAGAITLLPILNTQAQPIFSFRQLVLFVSAFLGLTLVLLGITVLRGTSIDGLLNGVFLGPLRHPGSYHFAPNWRPGTVLVASASVILAGLWFTFRERFAQVTVDYIISILRLVHFLGLLVTLTGLVRMSVLGYGFSYGVPLIWIWAIPLGSVEISRRLVAIRSLIAVVFLLQFLHAYPVSGSQISWASFLIVPLFALGFGETYLFWRAHIPNVRFQRLSTAALTVCTFGILILKFVELGQMGYDRYFSSRPFNITGAHLLRLPESLRSTYQVLCENASMHGDMVFSLPGMYGFNLWTGLPTPTLQDATHWFSLLKSENQNEIISVLKRTPRAIVINQVDLLDFLRREKIPMQGPLYDYLQSEFVTAFQIGGFQFRVHRGRQITPFGTAQIYIQTTNEEIPSKDTYIDFTIIGNRQPVSAIEIYSFSNPSAPLLTLNAANAHIQSILINSSGTPVADAISTPWPLTFTGMAHIRVYFNRGSISLMPDDTILYLKGAQSNVVGEARLIN